MFPDRVATERRIRIRIVERAGPPRGGSARGRIAPHGQRFGFREGRTVATADRADQATTETALESAAYADRIRRINERIALGISGVFAATGLLPITPQEDRAGVLWTGLMFFVVTLAWFRLMPPRALGDRRVAVFGAVVQPVVVLLLSLTGGNDSLYFPYLLLPVLVTVYSPGTRHTLFIGAVSAVSLSIVALVDQGTKPPEVAAGV